MKVTIDSCVFGNSSLHLDICELFQRGYENRCRILTDPLYVPEADPEEGEPCHPVKCWLDLQSNSLRQECELVLSQGLQDEALNPSSREIRITQAKQSDWDLPIPQVSVRDAIEFLRKPFRILVENSRNDRGFLLTVAESENRSLLENWEKHGWLCFEHTGGLGEMKNRASDISKRADEQFRVWMLFDGDRLHPERPNPKSERIKNTCGNKIAHHQLQRRSIENYLPIEALVLWGNSKKRLPFVNAFKALSRSQRHHFNMKDGFAGDKKRNDGLSAENLYCSLTSKVRKTLDKGCGDKLAESFSDNAYRESAWYAADNQLAETRPMINRLVSLL